MTMGTCLRMELTPSRDINSSLRSATRVSDTTACQLQTNLGRGTMIALCKLVQSRRPNGQDEDDADREGRKNDQKPISEGDHGCTCFSCEAACAALPPQ
jgi:hypothetical protein